MSLNCFLICGLFGSSARSHLSISSSESSFGSVIGLAVSALGAGSAFLVFGSGFSFLVSCAGPSPGASGAPSVFLSSSFQKSSNLASRVAATSLSTPVSTVVRSQLRYCLDAFI